MGGWRRAFCTSIPKDRRDDKVLKDQKEQHCDDKATTQSSKISSKFGFFSNPSTPRLHSKPVSTTTPTTLRCRTTAATTPTSSLPNTPKLSKKINSPRFFNLSNPSSPKSPSSTTFSFIKPTLRLSNSKSRCGICLQSVKTGQGTAIFTAECCHSFHFPCVSAHIKTNQTLTCPVCSSVWDEAPLLPLQSTHQSPSSKLRDHKPKPLRVYDDDEPLMSPTSRARFNPIPESDENEDEEEQNVAVEFQGFFANSAPLASSKLTNLAKSVEVSLLPEAAVVASGRTYETYAVVLKVKAPARPATTSSLLVNPAHRAPIDLVAVLDVSASGTNGAKLHMMRRAMRLVISSLCCTDRLSIVAFSATSKRLLPLRKMTTGGRRSARQIVDALCEVGQGTCVIDALKKAAKVLEDRRERNSVASIILLSDGHDERVVGPTYSVNQKRSPLVVSSTRFSHLDVPVHAVSFGPDGEPPEEALARCVGGLVSVVVQDLKLQLAFASGSAPAEIAAVYSLMGRPTLLGSGSVRIGNLYSEEERQLLVELKVPSSSIGSHHVLSLGSTYRHPPSQQLVYSKEHVVQVPRPRAVRSSGSPNIARLRNLHVATRAIAESRRLVEHNDLSGAHHLLSSARALLVQQSSSASASDFLRGLEAELAELQRRRQVQQSQRQKINGIDDKTETLTPTSAWRAAERLAKVAIMRKSANRVSDLHGFENARF